jgi:hypothetical protein
MVSTSSQLSEPPTDQPGQSQAAPADTPGVQDPRLFTRQILAADTRMQVARQNARAISDADSNRTSISGNPAMRAKYPRAPPPVRYRASDAKERLGCSLGGPSRNASFSAVMLCLLRQPVDTQRRANGAGLPSAAAQPSDQSVIPSA